MNEGYTDKARAIFLAALMVVSVFGATVSRSLGQITTGTSPVSRSGTGYVTVESGTMIPTEVGA
ncbi:surface glycoprotein [Halodesulfurarchaeum formicicum]|uniref:surface glycoprotein n=1 Tax=Halodesulfurarchaeum formicicum TaxID=1873524 RepID=UPI0009035D9C